jgi:hypothetical protein
MFRNLKAFSAAVVLAGLVLLSAGTVVAQDIPLKNWSAPSFWSPSSTSGGRTALTDLSGPVPFIPVTPCRVADTRGNGFTGQYGPPQLQPNTLRNFTIGGQCGIPIGAKAVSFEFTAMNMNTAGNLIAWQAGIAAPASSALNWASTTGVIANGIVVPINSSGVLSVQTNVPAGGFVDLIIDVNGYYSTTPATANPFIINSGTANAAMFHTTGGGEAVDAYCDTASVNCWGYWTGTGTGNRSAVFSGGRGMTTSSSDATYPAIAGNATGLNAYGGDFRNGNTTSGNALYAKCSAPGCYSLYVNKAGVSTYQAAWIEGLYVSGDISASGSKAGYVVDVMRNADARPLELGDVVIAVGSSEAVLGEIPVATVRLADREYDTAVVGIVDAPVYVPTPEIMQAYAAQEAAVKKHEEYKALTLSKSADRTPLTVVEPALPEKWIAPEMVSVHRDLKAQQADRDGHLYVVTLGAFKRVKVDASYGAIRPGDLLTTSSTPGHAMKVFNRRTAQGAIIGKALGSIDTGTGLIPVLVTLH